MVDRHFYRPAQGHGLRHDPLNAIVAPRPIGWISTQSTAGVANLAPYSFFNAFNYKPPIIGFASIDWKDSVANIAQSRAFGWNLATRALAEAMNATSAMVPSDVDEFHLAKLSKEWGREVEVPLVADAPVSFECKLTQIVQLLDHAGDMLSAWLVLGEVVAVHIDPACIIDGVYDTAAAVPILRAGGAGDYFEVKPDARFTMRRPKD